jgi:type 1 glutamine amidotransferase
LKIVVIFVVFLGSCGHSNVSLLKKIGASRILFANLRRQLNRYKNNNFRTRIKNGINEEGTQQRNLQELLFSVGK